MLCDEKGCMFHHVLRFDSFSVPRVCCCWASESCSFHADPLCASQCKHILIYLRICSALGEVTYWIVLFFFFFFYDRLGWRWANQKIHKWSRSKKNMRTCSLNTKDSMICSKRRDCSKRGDWGQRVSYAFKKLLTLLPTFLHTIIVPTASCTQYLLVPYSKYSKKILKMGHLMEVIRIDF